MARRLTPTLTSGPPITRVVMTTSSASLPDVVVVVLNGSTMLPTCRVAGNLV